MRQLTNVGLIECNNPEGHLRVDLINENGFHLKKVMGTRTSAEIIKQHYPQSEIVLHKESIMQDASIELVVISGPGRQDLDLVAEVLQSGKHVRVV